MCIKDLRPTLFLFQFFHEMDVDRAVRGGPWTFNQNLLVINRLTFGVNPVLVPLFHVDFRIQVHNLPCDFMSERVCKEMGNYIGTFVEADANNFIGIWGSYMCIRVSIDVRKPLKKKMKIKKTGGA